jgi:predicted alpha/beta-hydrolase family hydrolase
MKPLLLFAPGAGAPSTHPWMRRWAALLGAIGVVRPLDYDYMLDGRRRPDRLPDLVPRIAKPCARRANHIQGRSC